MCFGTIENYAVATLLGGNINYFLMESHAAIATKIINVPSLSLSDLIISKNYPTNKLHLK